MKRETLALDFPMADYDDTAEVVANRSLSRGSFGESTTKRRLFGVNYSVTDYNEASNVIVKKGLAHESFGVSALAVHGLVESVLDPAFRTNLNKIDLIVPDGQ